MPNVLCIGQEWRGSNASGLFYALSRIGCTINIYNERTYVSVQASSLSGKIVNKLANPFQISDFNTAIKKAVNTYQPDLILVYKGAYVYPETIDFWHKRGLPVVNFFPDVSFLAHGKLIPKCIPRYDHIFTTKTFAARDLQRQFNVPADKVTFVPHGFDPMIHRKLEPNNQSSFKCDASFIGNYSPHKASYLAAVVDQLPDIDLRIWGGTWSQNTAPALNKAIQGAGIQGDFYTLALNSGKINIALLSEKVAGASSGDQITSRTFHIPGAGGFMLHQRTNEVLEYFREEVEMACFGSKDELAYKIRYYLKHEVERKSIQQKGYERAQKEYSLDQRAKGIVDLLKKMGLI
jgi:spore maturation protein CgeB